MAVQNSHFFIARRRKNCQKAVNVTLLKISKIWTDCRSKSRRISRFRAILARGPVVFPFFEAPICGAFLLRGKRIEER